MLFLTELSVVISCQKLGVRGDVEGNRQLEERVVVGGRGVGPPLVASEFWRKRRRRGRQGGDRLGERDGPHHLATAGNEVIAVDWKGLKDVDQINMDSTSSLHGSSLHRPSTEVSTPPPTLMLSCPPERPRKDP